MKLMVKRDEGVSVQTAMWSVVFSLGLWNWLCLGWSQLNAAFLRPVLGLSRPSCPPPFALTFSADLT